MLKRIMIVIAIVFTGCIGMFDYEIKQETTKYLNDGYNVETTVWKDGNIIWAHYTFQEWSDEGGGRLWIPLDSVPQVKKRDYETAKRMIELFKKAKYP